MAKTVGDFVVERLRAWGVQRVFGYPGDGINGIMAGFEHAGGDYQQEVDLQTLFKDVAHNFVTTVATASAVRHAIDRAFRIALSEKCVTCVIVPKDLQEEKAVEQQEHAHNTIHSSIGYEPPR